MRYTTAFLRTRVARRVLLLFVGCALVPILALGYVAHDRVSSHLVDQSRSRLRQASKSVGMGVLQRLLFAEAELALVAREGPDALLRSSRSDFRVLSSGSGRRFRRLSLVPAGRDPVSVFGPTIDAPELGGEAFDHLRQGRSVLRTPPAPDGEGESVLLARLVRPTDPGQGMVWAEIDPGYLLGLDTTGGNSSPELPPGTELCVFGRDRTVLGCQLEDPAPLRKALAGLEQEAGMADLDWGTDGDGHLTGRWPLFLRPDFLHPGWTITVSESRADLLQPVEDFETTFLLILALTLAVVLALSNVQIRRSLGPLEKLWEATQRVAARDFGKPVEVETDDEFAEVAESFNVMARQLERQFRSLDTRGQIDRAILSALETESIIRTVLGRMDELVSADVASVLLMGHEDEPARYYERRLSGNGDETPRGPRPVDVPGDLESQLSTADGHFVVGGHRLSLQPASGAVDPAADEAGAVVSEQARRWVLFPVVIQERPAGFLGLGFAGSALPEQDERDEARRLADQVAVAVSNARLVDELDELTWGALTALARTIDAKSPWTAGHSERVTALALRLGEVLGLDDSELEVLQRGAILHDIGKIGVPAEILDKRGILTEEEWEVMRVHPELGARILEPIPHYRDVLPMVLHHHEWWDGSGYPHGLEGEAIPYHARVLAVPDVYDAVTSHRPYRVALSPDRAAAHLKRSAGSQFDPEVVEAFEIVLEEDRVGEWLDASSGAEAMGPRSGPGGLSFRARTPDLGSLRREARRG